MYSVYSSKIHNEYNENTYHICKNTRLYRLYSEVYSVVLEVDPHFRATVGMRAGRSSWSRSGATNLTGTRHAPLLLRQPTCSTTRAQQTVRELFWPQSTISNCGQSICAAHASITLRMRWMRRRGRVARYTSAWHPKLTARAPLASCTATCTPKASRRTPGWRPCGTPNGSSAPCAFCGSSSGRMPTVRAGMNTVIGGSRIVSFRPTCGTRH